MRSEIGGRAALDDHEGRAPARRRATKPVATIALMPGAAPINEIGGRMDGDDHVGCAPARREANAALNAKSTLPPAAPINETTGRKVRARRRAGKSMPTITTLPDAASHSETGGQEDRDDQPPTAPARRGVRGSMSTSSGMPLAAPVFETAGDVDIGNSVNSVSAPPRARSEVTTRNGVPPAATNPETGGRSSAAAPARRRAGVPMTTSRPLPDAAPNPEIGGRAKAVDQHVCAPVGEGIAPLAAAIEELVELQRQRVFCIKSQSRCDRSTEAFVARALGYNTFVPKDATPAERKALRAAHKPIWDRVSKIRTAIEKRAAAGESCKECGASSTRRGDMLLRALMDPDGPAHNGLTPAAYNTCVPIILLSAQARDAWDKHRIRIEDRMRDLARSLLVWPWVKSVAGFAELGLAVIIGETGNLSNYATKERVWKRLGLAVMTGMRQGNPGTGATKQDWIDHGYDPQRRAQVWAQLSDSMFKHQWRGDRDEDGKPCSQTKKPVVIPAHAIGPYGEVFGKRKAHTATREWTRLHRDNDARRIMSKSLVSDLWKQWRASEQTSLAPLSGSTAG